MKHTHLYVYIFYIIISFKTVSGNFQQVKTKKRKITNAAIYCRNSNYPQNIGLEKNDKQFVPLPLKLRYPQNVGLPLHCS